MKKIVKVFTGDPQTEGKIFGRRIRTGWFVPEMNCYHPERRMRRVAEYVKTEHAPKIATYDELTILLLLAMREKGEIDDLEVEYLKVETGCCVDYRLHANANGDFDQPWPDPHGFYRMRNRILLDGPDAALQ